MRQWLPARGTWLAAVVLAFVAVAHAEPPVPPVRPAVEADGPDAAVAVQKPNAEAPEEAATTEPAAEAPEEESSPSVEKICRTLGQAAADNGLPEEFFTRLIWQESRFDPEAVSPAGAQGIAQFMPQTAKLRGLVNAFEPLQALQESASYLGELRTTFRGSLGLAAAAYNAGPGQVEAWLAGRRRLPAETQAYVFIVTGHSAEAWASPTPPQLAAAASGAAEPSGTQCVAIAKAMIERSRRRPPLTENPAWGPWGVQLAGHWSEGHVLATYERLRRRYDAVLGERLPLVLYARRRFVVRVSEQSRQAAAALCARLRAAGGACVVYRNPRG
ncbi:lytic transglycosylase domain-containing protein [Reyranella sp.]|uniref:lytic transglycosylase domain-containing protein n=1 Tax=Reyranella sp. TaxID=1929291 RepID=UPI003BAD44DD